ncbi:lipid A deacylase LpxR family protein [Lysobacter sp. KIS68-7]|uniref:lipid A deacylase LpxR family protein n=1 Tax=Lysobacter sp. KIS68-7 TaxID=2904252 RepID=UPI001E2A4397|nr:lipid A deacylase LpxR family protein [Lysobacter sp. KIS68-7]UHQ19380.1 lipid A deacylase LpxR family protein [Lysobacter sp. KIS68-7]
MNRRTKKRLRNMVPGLLMVSSLCAAGVSTPADAANPGGALTLAVENDVLTGSDNAYTNGLGATWVSGDLDAYDDKAFVRQWGRFWDFLPFVGDAGYKTYASWTIAQEMHTPTDITLSDPPLSDQPYAGVLYVDNVLYARSERWTNAWELQLGVTGDASGAASTQRKFHKAIGADEPMGWHTQLPEEPIINVGFTTAHLWKQGRVGESAQWRLVPVANVGLGTYFTGVGAGMYGEVGWNLVNALGGTSLREGLSAASTVGVAPTDRWSVSFFGGVGGHAVAHYLPLDGTVFHDSRSVDTRPFVGNVSVGASVRRGRFAVSLSTNYSTKAFDGQDKGAEFANLSVSWIR